MKKTTLAAALAGAMALGGGVTAVAQNAARVYDQGPVWSISYIETQPGMFDDYISYLSGRYRQGMDAEKQTGNVLDYKVLALNSPRDGEADVILITQYKNMAVFDESLDAQERRQNQVWGSTALSNQGFIDREKIRKQRGTVMARELTFKK